MLLSTLKEKFTSLFQNYEKNEPLFESHEEYILVNGKPIITNKNSDINLIFPELDLEINQSEIKHREIKTIPIEETDNLINKDESSTLHSDDTVSLINNGVFPLFYIIFTFFFFIFLFVFEKQKIKSIENYIQIGDSKLFIFNFFKIYNINHLVYHTFTFYISILGFLIVYISFANINSRNKQLPTNSRFSNNFIYISFCFGFFSNLLKILSSILFYTNTFAPANRTQAININKKLDINHTSSNSNNLSCDYIFSLNEILYYSEIYLTIMYGICITYFLKEVNSVVLNNSNNLPNNANSNENSIIINNTKYEYSILNEDDNKINENKSLSFKNLSSKSKLSQDEISDFSNFTKNLEPKWLKMKIFCILYLSIMILAYHLLKLYKHNTEIIYIHQIANSYPNYEKTDNQFNQNIEYILAFLPYGIYLVNALFYFFNYGLLKNTSLKLFSSFK